MLLVVDDDPLILRTLRRRLRDRRARFASSATEAREIAAAEDGWRGFFVDVHLPEGSAAGLELLQWLADNHRGAERVIITGAPDDIASHATRLEATIIPKPFDPQRLAAALARCDAEVVPDPVAAMLARATADHGLTPREADLVRDTAEGREASTYWMRAGIALATAKTHRAAFKRKTGATSPGAFVIRLLSNELRRRR